MRYKERGGKEGKIGVSKVKKRKGVERSVEGGGKREGEERKRRKREKMEWQEEVQKVEAEVEEEVEGKVGRNKNALEKKERKGNSWQLSLVR